MKWSWYPVDSCRHLRADRYTLIMVYKRLLEAKCVANSVNVSFVVVIGCDLMAVEKLKNLC